MSDRPPPLTHEEFDLIESVLGGVPGLRIVYLDDGYGAELLPDDDPAIAEGTEYKRRGDGVIEALIGLARAMQRGEDVSR